MYPPIKYRFVLRRVGVWNPSLSSSAASGREDILTGIGFDAMFGRSSGNLGMLLFERRLVFSVLRSMHFGVEVTTLYITCS